MAAVHADSSGAQRRVVARLEDLYGMVIAVGLGLAVEDMLRSRDGSLNVAWNHAWLLAALLVTLVPFYQGALLHLDKKYEREQDAHSTEVLLLDFIGLFLEALLFV